MGPENPPEMEKLLMKYSNGSVPPLVAEDGVSEHGLLNEELLDIFQKGFSARAKSPPYLVTCRQQHADRAPDGRALSRSVLGE